MSNPLPTTVGVEIEVQNIAGVQRDLAYVTNNFARRSNLPDWEVKLDGSCGRSGHGVEVVSPILKTDEDLKSIVRACAALKRLGFEVTSKCGLHVHLGVEDLSTASRDRLLRFFVRHENGFFLLDPSRRQSTYCKPLCPLIVNGIKEGRGWNAWNDRYYWLNGKAFSRHRTVELRLMGGSLDEHHIIGWVHFLLHVYESCKNGLDVETWDQVQLADDFSTFTAMLQEANFDGAPDQKRAVIAREWALGRYQNVQGFQDNARIRAERRQRRLDAWSGKKPFVPIFSHASKTIVVD